MRRSVLLLAASLLAAACSSKGEPSSSPDAGVTLPAPEPTGEHAAELAAIEAEKAATASMTAGEFATKYAVQHLAALPYDPLTAGGLDLVQASSLALTDPERSILAKHGFAITDRKRFPTFTYGYVTIYSQDLPVYVSADSILYAVHKSYDAILMQLEQYVLAHELRSMLVGMRANLAAAGDLRAATRADLDVYLAVALSLLEKDPVGPVAGGDAATITSLVTKAKAASGMEKVRLFGRERDEDFSQFAPRGHYKGIPELEAYFRASMWLGRVDLRLLETMPDHSQRLNREQVEATLAVGRLMGEPERAAWSQIDATIGAFVGETDAMTPAAIDAFAKDLGVSTPSAIDGLSDVAIRDVLAKGNYGKQRISSHVMINGIGQGTMPLSASFLILGQRYVVDSHVFSNVVYDRVAHGAVKRMMPDPLDVAFAALGNDQAGALLGPELAAHAYAPDLHMMRFLVEKHGDDFWQGNLSNLWLGAIRALSPKGDVSKPLEVGLPSIAGTEAWGRRVLNTQLASWAELRHDTLLYAKQSYTAGAGCVFPDAYVEPYPEFFAKIEALASHGRALVDALDTSKAPWIESSVKAYFARLESVASTLREMADLQRKKLPFTEAHLAFINEAVKMESAGCVEAPNGWYVKLFYQPEDPPTKLDPTIADVHTQPTDEVGNMVGRVLHVATGMPRLMVVTAETCSGPRAYVGLASSYFEEITRDFQREDDQAWSAKIQKATPEDVRWMKDLVAR